jgi:hypothetical protein
LGWQFSSKLLLITSELEVCPFIFQDSSSRNCQELHSKNISKDEIKTSVRLLELMAAVGRKEKQPDV